MVALMVDENAAPTTSVPVYVIGVASPLKSARGTKVTRPVVVFSVHVPWFAMTTEVERQFGAVSVASHRFMRAEDRELPESFVRGRNVNMSPSCPVSESAVAAGAVGALTVTLKVDDPHDDGGVAGAHDPLIVLQMAYETGVAIPENVTNGTNVTVVPVSVHVPWPVTSMEFLVQPVEMVSVDAHSFKVDVLNATVPCVV